MQDRPQVIEISTRTILNVLGILVGLAVIWLIRDTILSIFIAILLAGVLYPFADWAERHRIPKGIAVMFVYILMIGIIICAFGFLVPAVLDQAHRLEGSLGGTWGWLRDLIDMARDNASRAGLPVVAPATAADFASQVQGAALRIFSTLNEFFGAVANAVIVIVLSFYIIVEDRAAKQLFMNAVPEPYRMFARDLVWHVVQKLGDWLRGQLLLSLAVASALFIAYSIAGLPYALLLALVAGLLEFIPYLGPIMAAIPAIFIGLTVSPGKALAAFIIILVIHQLENHVLVPQIMRKAVGLNPVVSIIAFLVGAKLFGAVGAIFAIPVATALFVIWDEWTRFRSHHHHA